MIRSHHNYAQDSPIAYPPVKTVRLLQSCEEIQAAVERARVYERRGVDEYRRRVGAYDRFLRRIDNRSGEVVSVHSPVNTIPDLTGSGDRRSTIGEPHLPSPTTCVPFDTARPSAATPAS